MVLQVGLLAVRGDLCLIRGIARGRGAKEPIPCLWFSVPTKLNSD